MAAKVQKIRGAWWVVVHNAGKKKRKRYGPTQTDKKDAERRAEEINARIKLKDWNLKPTGAQEPLPCDQVLADHLALVVVRDRVRTGYEALVRNHLGPFFGSRDLLEVTEEDVQRFVIRLRDKGRSSSTIGHALKILRAAAERRVRGGQLARNPVTGIGELMKQIRSTERSEVQRVQSWTHEEVERLLEIGWERETHLARILDVLFGTGCRLGEALGLQVDDLQLNAEPPAMTIRRSVSYGHVTTPKNGKARDVVMPLGLAERLLDQIGIRHRTAMGKGWGSSVPAWLFPAADGGPLGTDTVRAAWKRLQRRLDRAGIRPLRLHDARHTYASLALESGQSVRWVADQLGHYDVSLTLNTYAHALPREVRDLDFASFGGPGRPGTAPRAEKPFQYKGRPQPRKPRSSSTTSTVAS